MQKSRKNRISSSNLRRARSRIVIDHAQKTTPERDDNLQDVLHIISLNIYLQNLVKIE